MERSFFKEAKTPNWAEQFLQERYYECRVQHFVQEFFIVDV